MSYHKIPTMKKLLIMMLMPFMVQAQDNETTVPKLLKNEIGFKHGIGVEAPNNNPFHNGLKINIAVAYKHNFNKTQLGLSLESNEGGYVEYYNLSSVVLLNRIFARKKSYFYAGGAAGYHYATSQFKSDYDFRNKHGYVLGVQCGYVLYLGNHFAFTSELSLRSAQLSREEFGYADPLYVSHLREGHYYRYIEQEFLLTVPLSIGIRYRF